MVLPELSRASIWEEHAEPVVFKRSKVGPGSGGRLAEEGLKLTLSSVPESLQNPLKSPLFSGQEGVCSTVQLQTSLMVRVD